MVLVFAVLAWLVGIGRVRRGRRALGWGLAGGGVLAALAMAAGGELRPLVGPVGIGAISEGVLHEQRGERLVGMLSFSFGFLALLAAAFCT